ncbi:nitronate monooxygenase family protein [Pseudomaricurvus sp. HS19]|uniref:NAD(P)H-dependent flavin oxidoreductase n=1 Tax=Pseudomaricurvus sp. HS19 TaxID=2692626 RepID=UPI00136AC150|nr:nitronate monooxygenase family protein [Pseudomaricurvus sp. HS19]MYM62296.1 nitronate monooxygenase [Pseudomaricurvus sp. HS19]
MALPDVLKGSLQLPAIASPMFIVSNPTMVIEQCKAGVVGSFPSLNARGEGVFESWLQQITTALQDWDSANPEQQAAPFAVNLIVHNSNNRLQEDLELCVKYKVPVVITSLGAKEHVNETIHSYGGIVLHDIINDAFARKAIEKGADGLIAVATGAGGHAGTQSPFALIQEIRAWFDGPLALSGCIARGDSILAAQAMGADLAYMGSVFIATDEANAVDAYKQMLVDSQAEDIVYTNLFTGVHGNYLKPSIINAGLDPEQLAESDPSKMDFGSGGNTDAKAWKDIWGCGQGVGAVKKVQKVGDLVAQLRAEYDAAKQRLCNL